MLQKGVQYSSDSGICARIRIIYFIGKKELQDRRFITIPYLLCNFPKYPLVQIETVVHEIWIFIPYISNYLQG